MALMSAEPTGPGSPSDPRRREIDVWLGLSAASLLAWLLTSKAVRTIVFNAERMAERYLGS